MSRINSMPPVPRGGTAVSDNKTVELGLIAKAPATTARVVPDKKPKVRPEDLKSIEKGGGEVAVRDSQGNTLATVLKTWQGFSNGKSSKGFVAEKVFVYSATPLSKDAKPDPGGYGFLRSEVGKMRLITGSDGKVITDLETARVRVSEMFRNGGLTATSDLHAQTAQKAKTNREELMLDVATNKDGSVRRSTFRQWEPEVRIPGVAMINGKPTTSTDRLAKMSAIDRLNYMLSEAVRVAPDSAKQELRAIFSAKNLALMAAFVGAQAAPGLNVVANGLAAILLGKNVIDIGGKVAGAISKALSTKQPYQLVDSGKDLSVALVKAAVTVAGGKAARGVVRKFNPPVHTPLGLPGWRDLPGRPDRLSLPEAPPVQNAVLVTGSGAIPIWPVKPPANTQNPIFDMVLNPKSGAYEVKVLK